MFRLCFQRENKEPNDATLKKAIRKRKWRKTSRILRDYPGLVKDRLSKDEFDVLWAHAPLETIEALLKAWSEAHKVEDGNDRNLIRAKIDTKQWKFLKSIVRACPNLVTADDVRSTYVKDAPLDVFKLVLEQQPNAPAEKPVIPFELITRNELRYFCAVLDKCPAATEVKEPKTRLTPLLYTFQEKEHINAKWIGPILKVNPNAAKEKDFDGKTALHLAHQHGASSELIDMLKNAFPDATILRDNLGRFPRDLAKRSEKSLFTPANEVLILANGNAGKPYPDDAVVVCRGDMLMRDLPAAQTKEDFYISGDYAKHVFARGRIFETLLDEFSKMVGIGNKDVIQKAAATQTLAVQDLSNKNDTVINFEEYDNPGYWYQQEVLKLVMRVFCETRETFYSMYPSTSKDAHEIVEYLDDRKNGKPPPKPSHEYFEAYYDLTRWLTDGIYNKLYSLQGPVLKPLQSLFNKLFIRRGQTSVSVIGDMVRGTLLVDDMEALQTIINRIKTAFPNITENQFRQPDKFDALVDFLSYVHNDLNALPDSDNVLPYRFKANSSQKKKEKPLWFNLNFFLQVPEYRRVGVSGMFIACELQIGLTEEINSHRCVHDAYERDRILLSQPLLKNYDAMTKEKDEDEFLQISNCTEEDNKLIEKVLFGKIASEVLIPCTASAGEDNKNSLLTFENGPISLSEAEVKAGSFVKPEKLCLNNRSLNWYIINSPNTDDDGVFRAAFRAAGPYKLDKTKRYFVESFVCKNLVIGRSYGPVGLYAHVGQYMIQIACNFVRDDAKEIAFVKAGQNFSYLEELCPVPAGTTALEVIFYGKVVDSGEFGYKKMELSLKVFDTY